MTVISKDGTNITRDNAADVEFRAVQSGMVMPFVAESALRWSGICTNGDLETRIHPNPNYLFAKMFYQNISRARERLCIIVIDNQQVFKTLLNVKAGVI